MTMMRSICGAAVAAIALAAPAAATPDNPYGDDYVAIALAPSNGQGGYGASGTQDGAVQLALQECAIRANGARCVVAQVMQYGCVAYVVDIDTGNWAGGRGPDMDSATLDAMSKVADPAATYTAGTQCSKPQSPPG